MPLGNAKKCKSLKELLSKSDIVSIHVDAGSGNRSLIAEKELGLMKDKAFFINTSRGFVVDYNALARHIKSGHLSGAACDVFVNEPKKRNDKFENVLRGLPNVVLTPHIGAGTEEAQKDIGEFVSKKIIEYINTGNTSMSVNFPNIILPVQNHDHRILHIHKNVPGILAQINGILAKRHINIEGQYLKTNERIGYVITDVNKKYDKEVLRELKSIKETIRFRVLY